MRSLVFVLLLAVLAAGAQPFPQGYFAAPLDIPLVLAGNFAELRPNHFHGGLDFKTQGVEGKRVLAAADGFISRISVSPSGYGRVIYLQHPNGYTTVYGHLQGFAAVPDSLVRAAQYREQDFRVTVYPHQNLYRVRKGELIGWSGNTGSSGGPHLHFEIRDTHTENPYNPLLFGFAIADTRPPVVQKLWVYPLEPGATVNGKSSQQSFELQATNGVLRPRTELRLHGLIGFGLQAHDVLDAAENHCGLYSVVLTVDEAPQYGMKMTEHSFDESKQINAHIDYPELLASGSRIHRCYVLPNNRLRIYERQYGTGAFRFQGRHRVSLASFDAAGNRSLVAFESQLGAAAPVQPKKPERWFRFAQHNYIIEEDLRAEFPPNTFYRDLDFEYRQLPSRAGCISPLYGLHQATEATDARFQLAIRATEVPDSLRSKVQMVHWDHNNSPRAHGGQWMGDFLSASVNRLGNYCLMYDKTPPSIGPLPNALKEQQTPNSTISLKISDNLSGIKRVDVYIDGRWTLYEWDAKNRLLEVSLAAASSSTPSVNVLIRLEDYAGNTSEWIRRFVIR